MHLHVQLLSLYLPLILAQRTRINVTNLIKETADRVSKNVYTNTNTDESATSERTLVNTCGGIYDKPQFIIESPNYPSNYPSNLSCLFIFKGPYCATNYTLQFLDFDLEDNCNDKLQIFNEEFCGSINGTVRNFNVLNGILKVNFSTNEIVTSRGFRILVSRSICLNLSKSDNDITTPPTGINFTTTEKPMESVGSPFLKSFQNNYNTKQPACCAVTYSDQHFFLSSPGFPFRSSSQSECTFTIYRSSLKVCRLRIHMHFFSVGDQDAYCSKGFLQIDGKLLCGCHTGIKIVSPFDGTMGNTKVFRYQTTSNYNGFAMEVIQDECPKRYEPSATSTSATFSFYNDQINRILFPPNNIAGKLIDGNTEIIEAIDLGFRPRVLKHVYYFESPQFGVTYNKPRDVEQVSYYESSDLNSLYPMGNANACRTWGTAQWNELNRNILWQRMPKCNDISRNYPVQESNCKEYTFTKGYFQSPGYPYYYPKNLNLCYRFYKQQGFCKIRLIMLDFQVENSFDCTGDFLYLNNNFRYCGQSLANTFTLFDMNGKDYEEVKFITDGQNTGRGFRGIYEQIPCNELELPPPTVFVPPAENPIRTTTQLPPPTACSRTIRDNFFTIDIYDYGRDVCNFVIYKSRPDVCNLEITFVTFEFPCDLEHLNINGRIFCGQMSGETVNVPFVNGQNVIQIMYKRKSFKPGPGTGLKLHLVGRQSNVNCNFNENGGFPGVQRISHEDSPQMEILKNNDGVSVNIKRKHKEICGIALNIKTRMLQNKLTSCNILVNKEFCSPISEDLIYVPFKNERDNLELKFRDIKSVENIEFKELTCDNKFVV